MHGDTAACHFDGIVRALCVSDRLRHHIKLENNPTTLAARQAAIAAAQALAECVSTPGCPAATGHLQVFLLHQPL